MHILKWMWRWVFWLPSISRGLADSGETYVTCAALAAGIAVSPPGGLGYALLCEYAATHRLFMPIGWYALVSVMWYLLVGLVFYFLWPKRNYGKWHERGAW